jgi:RES domain-containing protein
MIGARLNRPNQHALYLATDPLTATLEYQQGESLMPPMTLTTILVTLKSVVDFTGGYNLDWSPSWSELGCNWRQQLLIDRIDPPSWDIADLVLAAGHQGILYPSQRNPGGICLVIYMQTLAASKALVVHDPKNELPSSSSSWPARKP